MKKILFSLLLILSLCFNADAAVRVMAATQSYSAPTICDTVTNTMTQHATTNMTVGNSSYYTIAYTAGNIGDELTGICLYVTAVGTGGIVTVDLQQNSAGWVDTDTLVPGEGTVTANTVNLKATGWNYFRFTSSFTATATTAGYYRVKITGSGMTGTTSIATDSLGTTASYLATDNRNTTTKPANTDDIVVVPPVITTITLTLDGTQILGSGVASTASSTEAVGIRCNGGCKALDVCYGATISDDTAANVSFTIKGDIIIRNGASSYRGTTGTHYPDARVSTYSFNENSVAAGANLIQANGGIIEWQGMDKTGTPQNGRTYASGVGTAADPMITSGDIGEVGDEVIIFATSDNATNYNECEHRFIKTKNSATSYVVSTTAGGAEAALTYTHTTSAKIINVERNVKTTSTSATYGWCYQNWNTTDIANTNFDWCSMEYVGSTAAYKQAFFINNASTTLGALDYSVCIRRIGTGFSFRYGIPTGQTYTGNIVTGGVSTNTVGGFNFDGSVNVTCNYFVIADEKRIAVATNANGNVIWNNCEFNACGKDGGVTGTTYLTSAYSWTFNNCNFNCNRNQGVYIINSSATFNSCNFGTVGKNQTYDINGSGYSQALFYNCNFGSDTLINGYTAMLAGSIIKFHNINNDATGMNHRWYTPYGSARCCMTGLADTTETASGHPTVGIYPEDATTGFTWEFQVPVFETYSGNILAYLQRNATFDAAAGSVTVEVWLPGSSAADATYTMSTTTGAWEIATAAKTYLGSIDAMATIKINAKTTTAGAYLYVGDLFGGTNPVTSLNIWANSMPSSVQFDQIGNPAAVWSQLRSANAIAGTFGEGVASVQGNVTGSVTSIATSAVVTLVDSIWDEPTTGHTTSGTFGEWIKDKLLSVAKFIGLK